jgi:Nucleotidyl transferase AbiEii toxin, Type IV TA system
VGLNRVRGVPTQANKGRPTRLPNGPWRGLLTHALGLLDELQQQTGQAPAWTFGGGTVLMLRYEHRRSKDIDIFLPDPQYLGYLSPRLSDLAAAVSADYVEGAGFIKLVRPEGEIDFVAASNLTNEPFDWWQVQRRPVRVETAAEIVAKKLWHRGDMATARDLFDLSLVIERDPASLLAASRFLVRHRDAFLDQVHTRAAILRRQFEAIDALKYRPGFDEAAARAKAFLQRLPGA